MRSLIFIFTVFFSMISLAAPLKNNPDFFFKVKGKVVGLEKEFVQLKQANGKLIWLPRTAVAKNTKMLTDVEAYVTMNELGKNKEQLRKLNHKK